MIREWITRRRPVYVVSSQPFTSFTVSPGGRGQAPVLYPAIMYEKLEQYMAIRDHYLLELKRNANPLYDSEKERLELETSREVERRANAYRS